MKLNKKLLIALLLFFILILAAYLRLYRIEDYMTFLGDEGRDVLRIRQMLVEGDLVFLGPTASVGGFFLGPMYYYFMTPFLWLWNYNPVGPAVMVALFGIATVFLLYWVGKKWFHTYVGLTSAALYAVSPLVIAYSRSSWNPNLLPFFSLLLMYLLWRAKLYKKTRDIVGVGIVLGLGIQFHYLFLFLILISGIWLLYSFRSIKSFLRSCCLVIAGAMIPLLPFALFEIKHNFPNLRSIIKFLLYGSETGFSDSSFLNTISDVLFRSFGRLLYRMPNTDVWSEYPEWHIGLLVVLIRTTILIGFALILFFVSTGIPKVQKFYKKHKIHVELSPEQWTASLLLLVWVGISIVLFGFYKRGIYDYYFGIFFAVPFLFCGILLWVLFRAHNIGRILSVLFFLGLFYFNWQGRPFLFAPNKQLEQTRNIAREAVLLTGDMPFNFALDTVTNSNHAYRYFFDVWNKAPITIENTDIDPERTSVMDQLIVICENPNCQPLGNPLWEIAGFGRAEVAERKEVFPVIIYRLVHYKE